MQRDMESGKETEQEGTLESVVDFGYTIAYPFALRAAVLLNVPKIIQSAGPLTALSAKEICARLAIPNSASSVNLEKILAVLSCHDIFSCTVEETESTRVKKYGLTSSSRDLALEDSPWADHLVFYTAPEIIQVWLNIHKSVLNPDEVVFEKAYGKGIYQYLKEDEPELGQFHVKILERISVMQLESLLDYYDGEFRSLSGTLVDVGGSQGAVAAIIASKYPNIKCVVNFDLPHVVSGAPAYRGVEHFGGSFLDFVPQGDLLLLKFVLLNWGDEETVKLLRNCSNALNSKGGKVIIVDRLKPDSEPEEKTARLRTAVQDLMSTLIFKGGKSRTFKQIQRLAEAGGFARLRIVKSIDTVTVMEAEKA